MPTDVRIDQNRITQLLANSQIVAFLPPLQELAKKKNVAQSTCKCSGRKLTGPSSSDKDAALRALADYLAGNPTAKAELARRLGASTLRIRYRKINSSMFIDRKL